MNCPNSCDSQKSKQNIFWNVQSRAEQFCISFFVCSNCDDFIFTEFCLFKDDGLYQHPHRCHDFIQCSNWRTFIKHCPEKLNFNIQIKQCDYAYNVKCFGEYRTFFFVSFFTKRKYVTKFYYTLHCK